MTAARAVSAPRLRRPHGPRQHPPAKLSAQPTGAGCGCTGRLRRRSAGPAASVFPPWPTGRLRADGPGDGHAILGRHGRRRGGRDPRLRPVARPATRASRLRRAWLHARSGSFRQAASADPEGAESTAKLGPRAAHAVAARRVRGDVAAVALYHDAPCPQALSPSSRGHNGIGRETCGERLPGSEVLRNPQRHGVLRVFKPSGGLEPPTPSLPWRCSTN